MPFLTVVRSVRVSVISPSKGSTCVGLQMTRIGSLKADHVARYLNGRRIGMLAARIRRRAALSGRSPKGVRNDNDQ